MRYYWHFITGISVIGAIVLLFFVFSLRVKNEITFTDDNAITRPTVTFVDPSQGPSTAKVTIVNFGDYECEGCAGMEQTLATLRQDFPDDVRIVWKDMPNPSHAESRNAAIAARCAGEQDKFWEFHDLLFANQNQLSSDLYTLIAEELELRDRAFASCVEESETAPLVDRTYEEGLALQLTATPTLFVNNERYTGEVDLSTLKAIVRGIIAAP
ncbi:MAG: DSBA oxidoreductase [Candidatus Uhrbacteria bacterium GW2011_GWD2_52_7]|uniref:DSBA oxidoreductase n=1 Tax=Candidatus Uhrbacteria bacterium GW2011_GWD2_52_7 TaxID=1618989 RepID=A0A0G2ADP9_9BACT|nr:MAG: DSBA oxidoreductase [Candidatus Uhrbacteria bacterium GW2011_GWD2_52_7]